MPDNPVTAVGALTEPPDERQVAAATRALALLNEQADELRAELQCLHTDLAQARESFSGLRATQLLEANENLVLAALHADFVAESAVSDLGELTHASQHDPLTDTPNRALVLDRLHNAIAQARRRNTRFAVMFVDIDHFKRINDTLGHAAGDAVLQWVARRLESAVRESDTVARIGGDEFLVLLSEISQPSDAALIATKMLAALSEPGGPEMARSHPLSASLGIALYPEDGNNPAALMDHADAAMYRSKRLGAGNFDFYDQGVWADRVAQPPRPSGPLGESVRLNDLRDANEQLVLSALSAQELEVHTTEAHRQQVQFLATVAHELRNPLTPIRTVAKLIGRIGHDDASLVRLQIMIERQVAHMGRLVDDLLDGARISTGKFRLERRALDLLDPLGMAIETCRPAMDDRQQQLTLQLPPSPLRVHGDPVRLAQIFSNLLDNASKYTPKDGRISLTVAAEGPDEVEVTVSDNGLGVTAEALPRIFDLFVQDPRAKAMHKGGLGIGLAVVRELVEAHGGSVVAFSGGADQGSRFVVTLPQLT